MNTRVYRGRCVAGLERIRETGHNSSMATPRILPIQAPIACPETPARWAKPARRLRSCLSGGCLAVALAGVGCSSSQPQPQYPQVDFEAPENWLPIPVAEFSKLCPAFVKAIAAKELKVPESGIMRVTDEGLRSYKVRIQDGAIKEVWRERSAK